MAGVFWHLKKQLSSEEACKSVPSRTPMPDLTQGVVPPTVAAMRIALYQPDMAPNVGTLLRLAACLGVAVDVIEPCGFPFGARALRRAGMDYLAHADYTAHASWEAFLAAGAGRLVLLTTRAALPYTQFAFAAGDVLLLGRESAGVPDEVHARADARVGVPMAPGLRSLNVAVAAAMVLGEALRQTDGFPGAGRESGD
jgi:tRNA (cytidine/uridine-2'-O-)-methyltransferase